MSAIRLVSDAIDPRALAAELTDRRAGALVTFEGWVRDHHGGRAVSHLVYEAYPALAEAESREIVSEALARFAVRRVLCVHRVGRLGVGELAVWIGVTAEHRGPAFRACEHVIDAIKARLPIWKHEHFADGTSEWVGCAGCAGPARARRDGEREGSPHAGVARF